jgi:putative PIN family toxin of toxin-antitoxin system
VKIVLDANTYISAYFWGGKPDAILDRIAARTDILFITNDIVNEIEIVIKREKFGLNNDGVRQRIAKIKSLGILVAVSAKHRISGVCRDSSDDKYIECALAAGADYVISGDRDLLVLKEYCGVKIVNARDYLDIVGG